MTKVTLGPDMTQIPGLGVVSTPPPPPDQWS